MVGTRAAGGWAGAGTDSRRVASAADSGRLIRKPWMASTPSAVSSSRWRSVSTPSATTRICRLRAMAMMAFTTASVCDPGASSDTNDRSIFSASTGNRVR